MNYIKNKNYIFGSIVLALALVFVMGVAQPSTAHASYYYYPPVYYPPTQVVIPPLYVSCYPEPVSASVGSNVTWVSSVSGGTGSYNYTWSGSNGTYGNGGSSLTTTYYNPGNYSAYLTVTSGSQSQSVTCSGSVSIYGQTTTYVAPVYNYPVTTYTTPSTYYYPQNTYTTYSSIQASCVANVSSAAVGSPVIWTATASGGSGIYDYSWSGTDGIAGSGQSISVNYSVSGQKTAAVTVYSNGQTVTENCYPSINIGGYQIVGSGSSNNGLDIGCYADPSTAAINQPITWSAEVTGGVAPYTYSWTGSDGLTGSQSSIIKYYDSYGSKSAIVSITSADGKTGTHACSNAVTLTRPYTNTYTAPTTIQTPAQTNTNANQTNNGQSAAALFSLQNVPWGWVAVLIILVLFATVLYLIFNRPKI